jgi:hypothetical protein
MTPLQRLGYMGPPPEDPQNIIRDVLYLELRAPGAFGSRRMTKLLALVEAIDNYRDGTLSPPPPRLPGAPLSSPGPEGDDDDDDDDDQEARMEQRLVKMTEELQALANATIYNIERVRLRVRASDDPAATEELRAADRDLALAAVPPAAEEGREDYQWDNRPLQADREARIRVGDTRRLSDGYLVLFAARTAHMLGAAEQQARPHRDLYRDRDVAHEFAYHVMDNFYFSHNRANDAPGAAGPVDLPSRFTDTWASYDHLDTLVSLYHALNGIADAEARHNTALAIARSLAPDTYPPFVPPVRYQTRILEDLQGIMIEIRDAQATADTFSLLTDPIHGLESLLRLAVSHSTMTPDQRRQRLQDMIAFPV